MALENYDLRETEYEELAEGLFLLAEEVRDPEDFGLADFQELYETDGGAALILASNILIHHEVTLPERLYRLFEKFCGPGDYAEEEFLELQEIYLRK